MVAPPKQKICLGQSVARLVEQSLPTQEIRSSNPVIGNFYFLSTDENKDKRQRFAELLFQILHSFNINVLDVHLIRFFCLKYVLTHTMLLTKNTKIRI